MYKFQYADIAADNAAEARDNERRALQHAIDLLKQAQEKGGRSREAIDALTYTQRLWTLLLEDLANPENGLPAALKASLISIGLWMLRESDDIREERSTNFQGLIDVSAMIRDGLR
jgi:flagellar biosynthesis activator protein FlaF